MFEKNNNQNRIHYYCFINRKKQYLIFIGFPKKNEKN